MPIYEYRCENGHNFEVMQRMTDDPVQSCEVCGAPVQRVFHPVAVHFKGSGFYNTDYGTRKRAREKESATAKESGGESKGGGEGKSGGDSGGSGGETKKSEPSAAPAAPKADAA